MVEQQPTYGFERQMNSALFSADHEKTFIDKVLDRKDSERLRELMMIEELNRDELLELLYLIVSINTKLVNFSDWDRYLLGKFLAWIRDFCTLHETLLDYMIEMEAEKKSLKERVEESQDNEVLLEIQQELNDIDMTMKQIQKHTSHNLKFLIDIFSYLANSTLSVSAVAFDTLSKSRFEYSYPGQGYQPIAPDKSSGGLFKKFTRR